VGFPILLFVSWSESLYESATREMHFYDESTCLANYLIFFHKLATLKFPNLESRMGAFV